MITPAPGRRRTRLTLVALGLLVLLAIVAFSSRSGFSAHAHAKPTGDYVSYAFTVFLILFVLAIPVAVYAFFLQARESEVRQKSYKARLFANVRMLRRVRPRVLRRPLPQAAPQALVQPDAGSTGRADPASTPPRPVLAARAHTSRRSSGRCCGSSSRSRAIGGAFFAYRWRTRGRRLPAVAELRPTVAEDFAASIGDAIARSRSGARRASRRDRRVRTHGRGADAQRSAPARRARRASSTCGASCSA